LGPGGAAGAVEKVDLGMRLDFPPYRDSVAMHAAAEDGDLVALAEISITDIQHSPICAMGVSASSRTRPEPTTSALCCAPAGRVPRPRLPLIADVVL